MDPLSISVSALTILGSVNVCLKKIKALQNAPNEIRLLAEDIEDLHHVTSIVHSVLADRHSNATLDATSIESRNVSQTSERSKSLLSNSELENISKLLNRLKGYLSQLEGALAQSQAPPGQAGRNVKYRKLHWLRVQKDVYDIRARLLQVKTDLSLSLSTTLRYFEQSIQFSLHLSKHY